MNRVINVEILERKLLWKNIVRMWNELISHIIMRHKRLLKLIIKGRVEGKDHWELLKLEYIQQIIKDQGYDSYIEMKWKVDNRE